MNRIVLFSIVVLLAPNISMLAASAREDKIQAFVSIPPQMYFVQRVGGERIAVSVMAGPGQSPHTYEPTPRQMAALSRAQLYFRIGVPFESAWMRRIEQAYPSLKVIDTKKGITLRRMEAHHHEEEADDRSHNSDEEHELEINQDPHIWLSPLLVKIQAQTIYDALVEIDPSHREEYQSNLEAFCTDLDRIDEEIKEILKDVRVRKFLLFHPSWGYFADAYGLQQIPIELEGKEPTAQQLTGLVELAEREGLKTIFIQPQFNKRIAETLAQTIGGRVAVIDPLARDYLANLKKAALELRKALQ